MPNPKPLTKVKNWSQDFLVIIVMTNNILQGHEFWKETESLNNQTNKWEIPNQIKETTNKDYMMSLWNTNKEKEICLPKLKVLEDKMVQLMYHNHRFWDQVSILNLATNHAKLQFLNNNQPLEDNLLETRLSKQLEMQSSADFQRNNLLTKDTANI